MEKTLEELSNLLKDFDKEFLTIMDIDSLNKPFKRVMYEVKLISTYWHDSLNYQHEIFELVKHLKDLHPDEEAETDIHQAEIDFVDLHVSIMPIYDAVIEKLRNEYILWRNFRCNTMEDNEEKTKIEIEKAEQNAWNIVSETISNSCIGTFTFTLYNFSKQLAPKSIESLKYHTKRLTEIHLNYLCHNPQYDLIEAH
ncbi:hypothetical protein TVAG_294060 [Trichomonas vaginalis G3]|uniref:Uncharacterized protein n=1 Tax=Trichomonas vaginalis (strain ATCC PRA-98 / G3) TaxID=412133 RepID=A2G2C1_TRIV3|nr:hypothetical protein TVAGG3_0541890 [Trichomonas vaginalis G3]EAX88700.1 hypothetical protein TVAG_294060 [Trichomonas vaginalis G3]KAI5519892.1 hypothetical protein TVAGG3_0541890 [Trichomonas vaginalis G3]|eukprot:XP_001301630.1 hypothetical protein [Trichomonas vaginalis G3]